MDAVPFWWKIHGGATHFPVALAVASAAFDLAGWFARREETRRDLHAAGYLTLLLAALASFATVFSGLMAAGWETLGDGLLGRHHLFVWPSFGALVALAVWRLVVGRAVPRWALRWYLLTAVTAATLVTASAYYGGELMASWMRTPR